MKVRVDDGERVPGETAGDEVRYLVPTENESPVPDEEQIEAGLAESVEIVGRSRHPELGFPFGFGARTDASPDCELSVRVVTDEVTLGALRVDSGWVLTVAERRPSVEDA